MDLYSFLLFVGPLIASPAALGVAWYLWLRTPEDFEIAQWRRVLVFLGLLSASGNVVLFCVYVIRRNIFHGRYALATGDVWSTVGFDLVLLAIFGSAFGLRPRPRRPFDLSRRTLGIRSLGADRNYDFLIVSIRNWRFAP